MITEQTRAWYHGSWDRCGIFMHGAPGVGKHECPIEIKLGAFGTGLDAGYAPRRPAKFFPRQKISPLPTGLVFCKQGQSNDDWHAIHYNSSECEQGEFLRHVLCGCTVLSWWDRTQGDSRGAINSCFIVEGEHSVDDMLAWFPRFFPSRAERLAAAGIRLTCVGDLAPLPAMSARELAAKFEDECMSNGTMGTGHGTARTERIVAAAIQYAGVVFSIAPPARHHNVIRLMMRLDLDSDAVCLQNQGFLTSYGRFVDRYEGAKIARAAGQIIREPTPPDMLTSEDVW